MNIDELAETLHESIARRHRPFAGALASFAFTPAEEFQQKLAACRWMFSETVIEPRGYRQYPSLVLGEEWLPIDSAVDALIGVLTQKRRLGPVFLSYDVTQVYVPLVIHHGETIALARGSGGVRPA